MILDTALYVLKWVAIVFAIVYVVISAACIMRIPVVRSRARKAQTFNQCDIDAEAVDAGVDIRSELNQRGFASMEIINGQCWRYSLHSRFGYDEYSIDIFVDKGLREPQIRVFCGTEVSSDWQLIVNRLKASTLEMLRIVEEPDDILRIITP